MNHLHFESMTNGQILKILVFANLISFAAGKKSVRNWRDGIDFGGKVNSKIRLFAALGNALTIRKDALNLILRVKV